MLMRRQRTMRSRWMRWMVVACLLAGVSAGAAVVLRADAPASATERTADQAEQPARRVGGESSLVLPDLSAVSFPGIDGHTLLLGGLVICALGGLFGLV